MAAKRAKTNPNKQKKAKNKMAAKMAAKKSPKNPKIGATAANGPYIPSLYSGWGKENKMKTNMGSTKANRTPKINTKHYMENNRKPQNKHIY